MEKRDFLCPSSDGIHTLVGRVYIPEGEIKGFFQIAHGMTEHIGRYDRIMTDLTEEGYLCFGYDHLGHGKTAKDKSELGFIAKKRGWELLAKDVKQFSDAVRNEFDMQNDLPYFLMGHSMGSFVVRVSAESFANPDKLIVMGTGGSNPASRAGIALTDVIKFFRGAKYISKLVDKLAFGSYNGRFKNDSDFNSKSWLSTDQEIRNKYLEDDYCTFKFTVSAMGDLMRLLKRCNRAAWFKNIRSDMPILLVSGEDDPVGGFGQGIRQVESRLKKQGKQVECILYKGGRHEILNDFTYGDVKNDVLSFISKN